MKNRAGIYKIVNLLNGKMYIGSSVNLRDRKYQHYTKLKNNKHDNPHLQSSYNKYGKDNFKWELIEEIKFTEDRESSHKFLLEREQYYIDSLKVCDRKIGYNSCPTAGSSLGKIVSAETRKKISNFQKGKHPLRHLTQEEKLEVYKKIGESNKGKKRSIEHRKSISESQKGKTLTKETLNKRKKTLEDRPLEEKITTSRKSGITKLGRNSSLECKGKLSNSCTWKIKIINIDTMEIFESLQEAANKYNIARNNIQKVCKGKRKTSGGYRWMYHEEFKISGKREETKRKRNYPKHQGQKVINLDTNQIFNSTKEAANSIGLKASESIRKACLGLQKYSKGYRWAYYEDLKEEKEEKRMVKVLNVDTGEIFESVRQAMLSVKLARIDSIIKACRGKQLTAGGYRWSYVNEPAGVL